MSTILQRRKEIHADLQTYPERQKADVMWQWKVRGLFGGHRGKLGKGRSSRLMALTLGGFGAWWLFDRTKLDEYRDEWNADQKRREAENDTPKDIVGLVIMDPEELAEPPAWAKEPPNKIEELVTAMFTLPAKFSMAMMGVMRAQVSRIPVVGPLYGAIFGLTEKFNEKAYAIMDHVQVGMITGMVAYMAAFYGALGVGIMMIGVCVSLTFTNFFVNRADTRLGRGALEWDYLLCSYYHKNRPDQFIVGYMKSAIMFYPRLLGFGDESERKLFNRLTLQASMVCCLIAPIKLVMKILGSNFSYVGFLTATMVGIFATISALAMYAPAICGSLSRYKLMGQTTELRVAGGVGIVASALGVFCGFMKIGPLAM